MSFLQKFKLALNPMYRLLKEVVEMVFLPIKQKIHGNETTFSPLLANCMQSSIC